MPLQSSWVDRIFMKLSLTYGRDFLARWEGLDMDTVKADWAHELAALSGHPKRIAYGIENLPSKAPTVIEFRTACWSMPVVEVLQLPAPDPGGMKRIGQALSAGINHQEPPSEWMERLRRDVEAGTASMARKEHYRIAVANGYFGGQTVAQVGDFQPIPRERWPEAMQKEAA